MKVGARRRGHTVSVEAGGDLAQVVGQDLLLVDDPLDLERQDDVDDLVVARGRTRPGRASLTSCSVIVEPPWHRQRLVDVVQERPAQPDRVDAVVRVETLVLGRDHGLGEQLRDGIRAPAARLHATGRRAGHGPATSFTSGVDTHRVATTGPTRATRTATTTSGRGRRRASEIRAVTPSQGKRHELEGSYGREPRQVPCQNPVRLE